MKGFGLLLTALTAFSGTATAQKVDPQLWNYVQSIQAIDNHAHVVAPDLEHDRDYDQLRCDQLPAGTALAPANTRFGPDLQAAWKALYGVSASSDSDADTKKILAAQAEVRRRHGDDYDAWILKQSGIEVTLANRLSMAPQLKADHFRWVPYDDSLLFPLDNSRLKATNPDRRVLFDMAEQAFRRYLRDAGLSGRPKGLDEYLQSVVTPTLERQKKAGAVAIKFEVAYLRALDFAPANREQAAEIYSRYTSGGQPSDTEYKTLQDYLFRYVAEEAGRLGLAVHIHTGLGCGEYFNDAGADPMLLMAVLNSPQLHKTNFVLLHGGTPFNMHNTSLILHPNVYVDTSLMELLFSPEEMARILRPWLEMMPEHIIFGTDASPGSPANGWEENTWIGSRHARQALAIALTQMMNSGEITRARAQEIADMVLRKTAGELYGIK